MNAKTKEIQPMIKSLDTLHGPNLSITKLDGTRYYKIEGGKASYISQAEAIRIADQELRAEK